MITIKEIKIENFAFEVSFILETTIDIPIIIAVKSKTKKFIAEFIISCLK